MNILENIDHGATEHLRNIWSGVAHPSSIPANLRTQFLVKACAAAACSTLILAEAGPVMAAVAGVAALDPLYETIHMADHAGAVWRAMHEHQFQLPFR